MKSFSIFPFLFKQHNEKKVYYLVMNTGKNMHLLCNTTVTRSQIFYQFSLISLLPIFTFTCINSCVKYSFNSNSFCTPTPLHYPQLKVCTLNCRFDLNDLKDIRTTEPFNTKTCEVITDRIIELLLRQRVNQTVLTAATARTANSIIKNQMKIISE